MKIPICPPDCFKCNATMIEGMALQNTIAGLPDFPGDTHACTLSLTGPPEMVPCWKCPKCGKSLTK